MKFDILTLFPEIFPSVLETSILGRAVDNRLLSFQYTNIRDYSQNKHNKVDDYPYGGGCGMVIKPQPIFDAYKDITKNCVDKPLTVVLSPRGRVFNQEVAKEMVKYNHIVLICGHYEGIDQRVIDEIADYELSVGDFVLTGGELGAMIVCDAVSRLVPGVLAEEDSFTGESHFNGLLEYPQYTRPPVWNGREVPMILFSGNQKKIDEWRLEQSLIKTESARPDLMDKTGVASYSVRNNEISKDKFVLVSFEQRTEKRDEVYKLSRKFSRKLRNQGFEFNDNQTVFSSIEKLNDFLSNCDIPCCIISLSSENLLSLLFKHECIIFGDIENHDSLYPYCCMNNTENAFSDMLNFLSIIKTIKKYCK